MSYVVTYYYGMETQEVEASDFDVQGGAYIFYDTTERPVMAVNVEAVLKIELKQQTH